MEEDQKSVHSDLGSLLEHLQPQEDDDDDDDDDNNEEEEEKLPQKFEEVEEEVDPRDLLTKEQIDYWKTIFDQFDTNKKHKIPAKTIGIVLRLMGLNPTKVQIKKHIQEIDPFQEGMIDFQSFLLPIAQKINDVPETHEEIINAFRVFDEDNNDFLYTDTLIEFLTSYGEDLEDFEIDALLKLADPKGTTKIYYVEFVERLMGVSKKPKGQKDKKKKKK